MIRLLFKILANWLHTMTLSTTNPILSSGFMNLYTIGDVYWETTTFAIWLSSKQTNKNNPKQEFSHYFFLIVTRSCESQKNATSQRIYQNSPHRVLYWSGQKSLIVKSSKGLLSLALPNYQCIHFVFQKSNLPQNRKEEKKSHGLSKLFVVILGVKQIYSLKSPILLSHSK